MDVPSQRGPTKFHRAGVAVTRSDQKVLGVCLRETRVAGLSRLISLGWNFLLNHFL